MTIISTNQMFDHYGWGIHLYLFAGFYALFGFSPLSLTLLNCLLGTLAGLVAYSLARMLGGGKAGRIAGLLVMFFPSLMFWSVTNLKDPLFILLALLLPWAWVRWHRTRAPGWLIIPALVPVAMGLIRLQYFGPALASSAVAWWLLVLKPSGRWKTALIACSLVAILGERGVVEQKFTGLRQYSAVYHRGIVATGGSIYRLYPDEYYKPGWESFRLTMRHSLSAYLNGWRHVLLDPVPWEARAGLSRAAAPQMFLWYPLLAVSVLGLWGLLKRWPGIALTILAQIALFGTVIVLGGGNIGTDLRMRDALTPLMLSLAAIGLAAEWTRGTHEQLRAS